MIICREMIRLWESTKLLVIKLSQSITGFLYGHMQSWSSPAGWSFLTSAVRPMFTSTMLDLSLSILRMLTSGMSLAKRTPRASQRTFSLPRRSTLKSMELKHLRICLARCLLIPYVQFGYQIFILSFVLFFYQLCYFCISPFVLMVLIILQAGKSRKSGRHANWSYWMQYISLACVMFGIKGCIYMCWLNFC